MSLILCMGLLTSAVGALANEKAEAKKHFRSGKTLMKAEDFSGAVVEFEASVELYPTVNGLFNLANCLKAVHRYGEALETLDRMESEPSIELNRKMQQKTDELRTDTLSVVATLTINVVQAGSTVVVDGREAGKSPLSKPLIMGPGEHTIEVSLEDHETIRRTLSLVSNTTHSESFQLELLRAELTVNTNVSDVSVGLDGTRVGVTPLDSPLTLEPGKHVIQLDRNGYESVSREVDVQAGEETILDIDLERKVPVARTVEKAPVAEEQRESRLSPLFWVGLGSTAAVGGVACILWGAASAKFDDFVDYDEKYIDPSITDPALLDSYADKRDSAKGDTEKLSNAAIGLGVTAGALAVLTVIVLSVDLSDVDSSNVSIAPTPGGIAVRF